MGFRDMVEGRTWFDTFCLCIDSLPNDKILDWSKLKAYADDKKKKKMDQQFKFVHGRVENIVGKGENAGFQHFLRLLQRFQKSFSLGVVKSRDCVVKS